MQKEPCLSRDYCTSGCRYAYREGHDGYEQRPDFDALVENTLTMMMAECAKEFEKLPIVQDVDILRNVIYSGVWVKYREMRKKREGIEKES